MVAEVVLPTLSLTESQALSALRTFLLGITSTAGGAPIEVIAAQVNRAPEPVGADFVLMTPLLQQRLAYNETAYHDNVLTGSIAGTVLTVAGFAQQEAPLATGLLLIDAGWPVMNILPNTVIVAQLTGAPGGVGTYTVAPSQTLGSETLYAGNAAALVPTQLTVQLDLHGPNSGNNARVVEGLFRSEYATSAFQTAQSLSSAALCTVVPLYCGDAHQAPFVNDQQQYEFRWSMDACLQINPVIGTPEQFAAELAVRPIEAATQYTGP